MLHILLWKQIMANQDTQTFLLTKLFKLQQFADK